MRKITSVFLLAPLLLSLWACSDDVEEPYTGPWGIAYEEGYSGGHSLTDEFAAWLADHPIGNADFNNISTGITLSDDYILPEYYKKYAYGIINWTEIVEKATEEEIQKKVDDFIAMTVEKDRQGNYDKFYAFYKKME